MVVVSEAKPRRRASFVAILLLLVPVLALSGSACGVDIGPTREVAINEPPGAAAVIAVEIKMGVGSLSISPGASGLASGVIRYNVESWKPVIERTDSEVKIQQGSQRGLAGLSTDIVNKWNLQFGTSPMRLQVSAGAYEGTYDLSGLTLQGLSIKDGAAKTRVMFNTENRGQIDRLEYKTGASTVTLTGLANANFKTFEFEGGAGTYSFDFSGQLRSDGNARIEAGMGAVRIVVPTKTAAWVTVSGKLNDISLVGAWENDGKTYGNPAATGGEAGKVLTIDVEMNVGSLDLVTE